MHGSHHPVRSPATLSGMSLRYSIRLLDHLTHRGYVPTDGRDLAKQLRIPREDLEEFDASLEHLVEEGKLELGKDGRYRLPDFDDEVIGILRLHPRGFGFVEPVSPTRHGDLFIPGGSIGDAISGDRVRARVLRRDGGGRGAGRGAGKGPAGRIVEVIERGRSEFVGTLVKQAREWIIEPDGRILRDPVVVRDPFAKNAKAGDKVVFEILHYPDERHVGEGVIVRRLGESGRPDVETQAVIAAHGLRQEFPPEAIDEASGTTRSFAEESDGPWKDRDDLTRELIFTIDPPDAKDFDDAISIEHDSATGHWILGVHIADVSHFVAPDSALDAEARARGNSVYLPRLVIPMLPETLSNGVCSLQEGVVRFTKSAFIEFDPKGRVMGQRLASTVIRSAKRLTYLEAQALIDGDPKEARKHAKAEPEYSEELIAALRDADRLAKILRKRRQRDGMVTLNLPEVELVFDENGHVVDAQPEDDAFTHTLIEMFMVEANEALARVFADLSLPLIRRIHPDPTFGDIETLRTFARLVKWRLPDEPSRRDLQELLEATRDTPAARAIHYAVLRTFSKATYSPATIGHFALASDHYTHFTSPIRRYPDLTVHRAMAAYLDETDNGRRTPGGKQRRSIARRLVEDERILTEDELLELGRHCSDTEKAAEEAERELRMFLVLQMLQEKHLGEEFEAIVTGVSPNAVFVSLQRFLVDGIVKIDELSSSSDRAERWNHSESTGRLTSARSGVSIGLGDLVQVQIAAIDLAARTMDVRVTKFLAGPEPFADDDEPGDTPSQSTRRTKGYKGGRRGQKSVDYTNAGPNSNKKRGRSGGGKSGGKSGGKRGGPRGR